MKRLFTALLLATSLVGAARAQETGAPAQPADALDALDENLVPITGNVTEVIFGELGVNATGEKPGITIVTEPPRPRFNSMTHVRRDWNDHVAIEQGWVH